MKKNQILKAFGTEYKEMTLRLLEQAKVSEMIEEKCGKSGLIGIKPNLVSPSTADMGATTHPEIVAGIIEYLKAHSFTNIIMLESSWVGAKTYEAIRLCGYNELSKKYDVPFIDLQKDSFVKMSLKGQPNVSPAEYTNICKTALKLDFLINVPVLKGHCQTLMTCALKNLKGLLPSSEKRRFHSLGLHRPIALLNKIIPQDLIVVDNICGDLDFEDGGNPVTRNSIMLFADPVLADVYGCKLMHINPDDVGYIALSEKLGVGSSDLSHADIFTVCESDKWKESQLFGADKVVYIKDLVNEVDSCSACYGYLLPALDMLKQEGLIDKLNEKICIGQGYKGKTGKLGVGNCTLGFEHCIKGCPPTETQIYTALKKYIADNDTTL